MATELSSKLSILDCAIGAISIKETTVTNFDIDDFVHFVTLDHAEKLNLYQKASRVDPALTKNRTPVAIGDVDIGGF